MTTDGPEIQREHGGHFAPGVSANPKGKPLGARHRATRMAEKLMAGDAEAVETLDLERRIAAIETKV